MTREAAQGNPHGYPRPLQESGAGGWVLRAARAATFVGVACLPDGSRILGFSGSVRPPLHAGGPNDSVAKLCGFCLAQ